MKQCFSLFYFACLDKNTCTDQTEKLMMAAMVVLVVSKHFISHVGESNEKCAVHTPL